MQPAEDERIRNDCRRAMQSRAAVVVRHIHEPDEFLEKPGRDRLADRQNRRRRHRVHAQAQRLLE